LSDQLLPRNLRHARTSLRYIDSTSVSRGTFTGALVTAAKGGDRLGLTLEFTKHGGLTAAGKVERALLRSWLARLRGRQNRAYLYDLSSRRRGTFSTGELLANNDFANGATGWSAFSPTSAITASDRVLRVSRILNNATNGSSAYNTAGISLTQYAPYVARALFLPGRNSSAMVPAIVAGTTAGSQVNGGTATSASFGLISVGFVAQSSSPYFISPQDGVATGVVAGDYFEVPYISCSRCAFVDAGTNSLLRSDEFDNASWSKTRSTVTANAVADPLGGSTADQLIEDSTASNTHSVGQVVTVSSSAADFCFSVALRAGTRTWGRLQIFENTGSTNVSAYFNLSSGAVGTTLAGANWSGLRTATIDLGNGWYICSLIGRKTNAATGLTPTLSLATADNTGSYSGDGASYIYAWRATLAASSFPVRLAQTTTAASTGTPPTGSVLHLKGLPVSSSGLLEIDDQVEVVTARGSELKIVTAQLNSDAAGRGHLQFEPPIRTSPIDNAPVVIHQPMGRFLFTGDTVGWDNDPGRWTSATAEFEEAI